MADINIGYNINVNASQATGQVNNFDKAIQQAGSSAKQLTVTTHSVNTVLFATNQIVRDLPFGFTAISNNLPILVDQFSKLKEETGSVSNALKGMFAGLLGPSGISIAISAVISGLTTYALAHRSSKDSVEKHKETVDELSKSLYDLRNNLQKASISTLLSDLAFVQSEIAKLEPKMARKGTLGTIAGTATPEDIKRLDELRQQQVAIAEIMDRMGYIQAANNGLAEARLAFDKARTAQQRASAAEEIKYYENIIQKENELYGLRKTRDGGKELEKLRKQTKDYAFEIENDLRKSIEKLYELEPAMPLDKEDINQYRELIKAWNDAAEKQYKSRFLNVESEAERLKRVREENQQTIAAFQALTSTLQGEFSKMWSNIFGEANSLLEIFMQKFLSYLAEIEAKNLAKNIIDIFVPGGGSMLSEVFGLGSAPVRNNTGNISYVVLDNKIIGTAITKNLPDSYNKSQRLGRL